MASRRRGKGRRKVGRKYAGCAAGSDIVRNSAARQPRPLHSQSPLPIPMRRVVMTSLARSVRSGRIVTCDHCGTAWRRFFWELRAGMFALWIKAAPSFRSASTRMNLKGSFYKAHHDRSMEG